MEIIKLNLIPSGVNPTCHCSQYDNGRVIRIDLFDGLTPYVLQSGDTVTLNVRKSDNTIVTTSLTATQGNTYVNLVTTEQICACVGYNLCDLTITNGSTVIGTLNFIMAVERDVLADGIPSQSVIEDLDALVAEAVGDQYYTKTDTDALLDTKADKTTTYTKTEIDNALTPISNNVNLLAKYNCWAYFASVMTPIFSRVITNGILSSLTITFPSSTFRLYSENSGLILQTDAYYGQSYTLTATGILVYDIDNNIVKTDTATNTKKGNYILLLGVGATVSGVLAPYYFNYFAEIVENPINSIVLNEKKAQMYTGSTDYVIEENIVTGKLYFNLPALYIRCIATISYDSMTALATELGVELKTSPNLVDNCIEIANTDVLVFDTSVSKCKIVNRSHITINHIVILSQAGGRVVYARSDVFPMSKPKLEPKLNFGDMLYYSNQKKFIDSVGFSAAAKFVFFTDIHGGAVNMKRLVQFSNLLGSKVTAIINGGDTVQNKIDDGLAWYNNSIDECNSDVLVCIGNHDQWTGDPLTPATKSAVYSAFIAPMIEKVTNIEQPLNASTDSLCYYYKDYGGVRVIVLDAMVGSNLNNNYDSDQDLWFKQVLSDAKTNSKAVICVAHAPFDRTSQTVNEDNIAWNSWVDYANSGDGTHLATGALEAVDSFINDGGEFVCWLCGHTHHDYILTDSEYPKQFMIDGITANYSRLNLDGAVINDSQSGMYDAFTYIGVDTTHKFIKLWRVGYNMDGGLKRKETLCYDYGNAVLISCN